MRSMKFPRRVRVQNFASKVLHKIRSAFSLCPMHPFTAFVPIVVVLVLHFLSQWQIANYSDEMRRKYATYGDKANPPVVVIPGLDGAVSFFGDVIPELARDHYVVVFELPYRPRNMQEEVYTFKYINYQLRHVLMSLRIRKTDIIGESFGGVVAQHFAIEFPEAVNKLVLLSSLAKTELPPEILFKLNYLLPIVQTFGSYFPALAQMLFAQIHVDDVVEPSEPEYVRRLFIKEASFAHFYSVMARIKIVSRLDIVDQMYRIRAPALVVYGQEDHFTRKSCLELHRLLPRGEIAALPGGHLPHITSPGPFVELVREFLAREVREEPKPRPDPVELLRQRQQ